MGIPHQIVHLIAVHGAVDDLVDVVLRGEMIVPSGENIQCARLVIRGLGIGYKITYHTGVHAVVLEDHRHRFLPVEQVLVPLPEGTYIAHDQTAGEFHVVETGDLLHHRFEGVGIGCVTDVMQQSCGTHRESVLLRQRDGFRHLSREMICTQTVLETGVVRSGEDKVRGTELLDSPEPLHLMPVQKVQEEPVDTYASVHWVMYGLDLVHGLTRRPSRACRRHWSGS